MVGVDGNAFTVTVAFTAQPVPNVYDITDVPADTPVTTPPALIVATAGVALLQVPPAVASANTVVKPAQTLNVPVMTAGSGFTVTTVAADAALWQPAALVT